MHAHKEEYLDAKKQFEFLVQEIITRMSDWEEDLPFLVPENCTFRINRDTRFSDNKSPYKDNFGAYFAYGGKKGGLPGYYLHVSPNKVFVAAGLWMPEADKLIKIRRHIVEHGHELEKLLKNKKLPALDTEHMLKRPPKGFSAENEYVELLKYKSFTMSYPLEVNDFLKPGFGKRVDKYFKTFRPLNQFLYEGLKK